MSHLCVQHQTLFTYTKYENQIQLIPEGTLFLKGTMKQFKGHASTATHDINNNPDPQQYLPPWKQRLKFNTD